MAAPNTTPIYSRVGDIQWGTLVAANTATDGTGTVVTIFVSDATNGGRIEKFKARPLGTNVATVLRFFINNGSTNTVAANNSLIFEITIAAVTLSQVAAQVDNEWLASLVLPPGYKVNCTIGTAVAAGIAVTAFGGKY